MVEVVGTFGDAFEGMGEFGLFEYFAGLVEVAIAQEDAFGFGKLSEILVFFQIAGVFVGQWKAVASELLFRGRACRIFSPHRPDRRPSRGRQRICIRRRWSPY